MLASVRFIASIGVAFVACSTSSSQPDGGGNACNTLSSLDAPLVNGTQIDADAPAATGGTIADGKYFLTSAQLYAGGDAGSALGSGDVERGELVVTGSTWQWVACANASCPPPGGGTDDPYNVKTLQVADVQGGTLDVNETCGREEGASTLSFSAQPGQITFYDPSPGGSSALWARTYVAQ